MRGLGFRRDKGRHYAHAATPFIVEFPNGPLMVGDQPVTTSARYRTPHGVTRLLTPTDAVKDRLAAFFHWSDRQSLEQALAIARHQPVKLGEIERWAKREPDPAAERYQVFAQRLRLQKK